MSLAYLTNIDWQDVEEFKNRENIDIEDVKYYFDHLDGIFVVQFDNQNNIIVSILTVA